MEAKGFYITTILNALMNPSLIFPNYQSELVLVKPDDWYPGQLQIELTDVIEKKFGKQTLMRIGRKIIQNSKDRIKADGYTNPLDYFKDIDKRYLLNNRGPGTGRLEIIDQGNDFVILKNTTPYNCILAEGIYNEIINIFDYKIANVRQIRCKEKGDLHCEFEIKWK